MINHKLVFETAIVYLKYGRIGRFRARPFRPRSVILIPTHRCNAHCLMCGIWKEKSAIDEEITPEQYRVILNDPLFRKLEFVGINGGESVLRKDLIELADISLSCCPSMKRLSLVTNGILTERLKSTVPRLADLAQSRGVLLDVSVSVHGLGSVLNEIYGVEDASVRIRETLDFLKTLRDQNRLSISMNAVLLKSNLHQARELFKWASEMDLDVRFVIGEQRERFRNEECGNHFLGPEDRGELIEFLNEMKNSFSLRNPSSLRYRELVAMFRDGKTRSLPCAYEMGGVLIGYDGSLYYCSHSRPIGNCLEKSASEIFYDPKNLKYRREALRKKECRQCPPYTLTRWELQADILRVFRHLLSSRISGFFRN